MVGENKISLCFRCIKFRVKKKKRLKVSFGGMGCVCSKGVKDENRVKKGSRKSSKRLTKEVVEETDNRGNGATVRLISPQNPYKSTRLTTVVLGEGDKKPMVFENGSVNQMQSHTSTTTQPGLQGGKPQICRVASVQNGVDGAQVAAGWPSWLASVAGEAIKGWIPRKAEGFEKLEKIGQGTYSSVYKARDLETKKFVALKKVRFASMDPESVRFMAREILVLRRLDHPNIMKLEGLVTSRVSGNLYLVFEYMEHDLSGLAASPVVKFTEPQIKCFMQQLFRGLEHCHSRGVLHRDIKCSNLLIDDHGNLKIGDFGLATIFHTNQQHPLTSRVVTLWYRPPELLLGATYYGGSVDLWSSGCILAELFVGKPIMSGRTEVEQLHKIFKLCGSPSEEYWKKSKLPHATIFKPRQPYKGRVSEVLKEFPPTALSLLQSLLAFEPEHRGSAGSALRSEFFTTNPLPCDPSSLPKYPPCKEFDAKMRDEEARRQRANGGKGDGAEHSRKGTKESKAVTMPNANAELPASMQKWKEQANPNSNSEIFNPHVDSSGGQSMGASRLGSTRGELKTQRSFKPQATAAQLSRFSSTVAAGHGNSQLNFSRDTSVHSYWPDRCMAARYELVTDAEPSNHLIPRQDSSPTNNGHSPHKGNPAVYAFKKTRMHYSGPLLPPGGSIEEMLKEHEKHIQIAVRKARGDKNKSRKDHHPDNGQTGSLLGYINNGQ